MKTRIIRIGKWYAIRIPKSLLEQSGFSGEVDIQVQDESLVVRPSTRPRAGWAAAFREMALRGHDALVEETSFLTTSWEER
jgi:antitoxin MazE